MRLLISVCLLVLVRRLHERDPIHPFTGWKPSGLGGLGPCPTGAAAGTAARTGPDHRPRRRGAAAASWLPDGTPGAIVLALHGFNDYSNAFATTGQAFAASGIAVFAYDQRGFGAGGAARPVGRHRADGG